MIITDKIKKYDKYFLRIAKETSSLSKDPSTKVGAVLTINNRIISTGFNGFPSIMSDDETLLDNRETKIKFTIHAEKNAILDCANRGISVKDTTIYVTHSPCLGCILDCIQSGVIRFVYIYNKEFEDRWFGYYDIVNKLNKEIIFSVYKNEDL